ncbi:MAG: PD40 domain-containing protein [Planctomycetes bacterium]|nr:PD40 domain-containing protein [Planctomycetota bacterium]
MKNKIKLKYIIPTITALLIVIAIAGFVNSPDLSSCETSDQSPAIRPDYSGVTIPPNIAPMNFNIEIQAEKYLVKAYCDSKDKIEINSSTSKIIFPAKPWHNLLKNNKGKTLNIDIYTKTKNSNWLKYKTIENNIAAEDIDPYLFYRKIHLHHYRSRENGPIELLQQNLTNFKTRTVITNQGFHSGCVNCHSPLNHKTEKATIGIRSGIHGTNTLYIQNDKVQKIGTKFGYNSWHPDGKIIAYSKNKISRFFHLAKNEVRDAIDMDSMIAYYNTQTHKVTRINDLAQKKKLESYPMFSADGKHLYYCSTDFAWKNSKKLPPNGYDKVRYDLMRIAYDITKDIWGTPEPVLPASQTKKSALMPRTSPDGRWLITCLADYGSFPAWLPSSDLYITDLKQAEKTGKFNYEKLSINTDQSQSWHCFSSNSKWLVYSSKQQNGLFTRTYITHIDDKGQASKSFVVPQKNPLFYDSHLETYSFPELSTQPTKISAEKLIAAVRNPSQINVDLPITMATPKKTSYPRSLIPYTESE